MPRFTTEFMAVPASAMMFRNSPAGPAAYTPAPRGTLSSLTGIFAISADTARLIGNLLPAEEPRRLAA
jgi:hypothetical protein